jgi:hypothetical protein
MIEKPRADATRRARNKAKSDYLTGAAGAEIHAERFARTRDPRPQTRGPARDRTGRPPPPGGESHGRQLPPW